jgi:hypothetical protein
MRHANRISIALLVVSAIWVPDAAAQTPPRPPRDDCRDGVINVGGQDVPCGGLASLPFDILPPGARSLGLGGAFAAVADDATAAEANPAGQTILTRPEVSIHGRNADIELQVFDPNYLDGSVFGSQGPGPFTGYEDSNTKLSFASVVYPINDRFVVSGYYHNAGAFEASSSITSLNTTFIDTYVADTSVDVESDSFGLSGAFRINDLVSIGASIKYSKIDLTQVVTSSILDFSDIEFAAPNPIAAAATINEVDAIRSTTRSDDEDFTFNVGVLFNPNGTVSGALVYKDGGSYDVDTALDYINIFQCNGAPNCAIPDTNEVTPIISGNPSLELPDIFTIGVAARPTDTWLLALQIDRIDYENLPPVSSRSLIFGVPVAIERIGAEISVHGGVEKTLLFEAPVLGMSQLALRAGAFSDRDHDGYPQIDTIDTHWTVGIGTVIFERLQVDAAAEFSDKVDTIVLSSVYRF